MAKTQKSQPESEIRQRQKPNNRGKERSRRKIGLNNNDKKIAWINKTVAFRGTQILGSPHDSANLLQMKSPLVCARALHTGYVGVRDSAFVDVQSFCGGGGVNCTGWGKTHVENSNLGETD